MDIDVTRLVQNLDNKEINALLKLYYNRDGVVKGFNDFEDEILHSLSDKNLINVNVESDENVVGLTDYGLSICGSIMVNRINENRELFKQQIQMLPERAVACLINRVMWKDILSKESGLVDQATKPYILDESLWYERALLKDERIVSILGKFYNVLEELGFIENIDGQRWCSPEIENFLRNEYKTVMDLAWAEEDALKYYFFFYVYARDQKNLINFSGGGEEFRSMFYREENAPPEYWFSSNLSDPLTIVSSLGVSEKRIMDFLEDMESKEIVNERFYPLSSFSFFNEEEKIFVINDIKGYMDYIINKFLTPVVDSLIKSA